MTQVRQRRAWVEQIMGLPVSVHMRGPGARRAETDAAVQGVFADLGAVDLTFSTYRPDSEVSRLNQGEVTLAATSPVVREVAELCEIARQRTRGTFDAWRTGPGGTRFDPTGLVKGWAVERAAQRLFTVTGHDFYVNAGGDTVLHCAGPGSAPWRVGIEDPDDLHDVRHILALRSGAVATSGSTHRGQHIVDPATGAAANPAVRAVTVVGPSLLWADVYATAAVVLGADALPWVEGLEGYEAFVVGPVTSGATSGFAALTTPVGSSPAGGGRSTDDGPRRACRPG